jgi:hypothetical protein
MSVTIPVNMRVSLMDHDLIGKPVPTFPDHGLS